MTTYAFSVAINLYIGLEYTVCTFMYLISGCKASKSLHDLSTVIAKHKSYISANENDLDYIPQHKQNQWWSLQYFS